MRKKLGTFWEKVRKKLGTLLHFLEKSAQKTGGTFALFPRFFAHFFLKSAKVRKKLEGLRKKLGTFWEKVRKKLGTFALFQDFLRTFF